MVGRMVKKRELPKPTEGELQLLGILWGRGPSTVRELFEEVNAERPVVYTGVLKLLQIMTEKGLLLRDERDGAHVSRAGFWRGDTGQRLLRELSESFFAGRPAKWAQKSLLCIRLRTRCPVHMRPFPL